VKHPVRAFALALAVAAAAAGPAAAVDEASVGIKVHRQSNINYVTGGAGEAAEDFAAVAARYPIHLRLTVDGVRTDVIEGVRIRVVDTLGNAVVDAPAEGPLFYVNPPSGRWTFEVEWHGKVLRQTKDLTGRRYLDLTFDLETPK
jgi:hypothetical protein